MQASEEIVLLQKELAQRRVVEAALRAAAEAAIQEAQAKERYGGWRLGRWSLAVGDWLVVRLTSRLAHGPPLSGGCGRWADRVS